MTNYSSFLAYACTLAALSSACSEIEPPPAPTDTPACGARTTLRGKTERTITFGGNDREYIVHIPTNLDPSEPVPVVYIAHGFFMSGSIMYDQTRMAEVAEREGFVAIFPTGAGGEADILAAPWGVTPEGQTACGLGSLVDNKQNDDIALMKAILADVKQDQCVDDDAVFFTGFSMGGFFSNHLGCQDGSFVRAIAPHSGGTYPVGQCQGGPVPVMLLHGTSDGIIDYQCGTQARDLWLERNGCSSEYESRPVEGGTCDWYQGCDPGGQVVMCTFPDMAHAWAGSEYNLYGTGPGRENATELVWSFFKSQL